MFVLKSGDTNANPSELDGEGDLNADYAERVTKFLDAYSKRPAPPVPGLDPDQPPLFKGYPKFDYRAVLGECGDYPYGYVGEHVKPCIFFKLNNIWGWEPKPVKCGGDGDYYDDDSDDGDDGEEDGLPKDECPPSLTKHLFSTEAKEAGKQNIWIDCNGRNVGYHSPLVAIQVDPKTQGQLVHVECRAYYRGVRHDKKDKLGLVQFEVQIL